MLLCLELPPPAPSVSGRRLVAPTLTPATSSSASNARLTPSCSLRSKTAFGARLAKRTSGQRRRGRALTSPMLPVWRRGLFSRSVGLHGRPPASRRWGRAVAGLRRGHSGKLAARLPPHLATAPHALVRRLHGRLAAVGEAIGRGPRRGPTGRSRQYLSRSTPEGQTVPLTRWPPLPPGRRLRVSVRRADQGFQRPAWSCTGRTPGARNRAMPCSARRASRGRLHTSPQG